MGEIPFDKRLWRAREVAAYLGWDYDTFMKTKRYTVGFPLPLPAFTGQPRWSAQEVSEWALSRPDTQKSREMQASA